MSDINSLLDMSRYPSVALIDVQPSLAKAENVGNTFNLTETHLPLFAFKEPRGSRTEGVQDSTPPQTVTTGTRDSLEGEKQTKERSPRSTLEGPMRSNSTLASAQHLTEAHGMRGSNDWRREYHDDDLGDEDDEEDYEENLASGAHRGQDSGSGEESNLRRSARNHGTDSRRSNEKRKVGRPIIYCGDPDSPDLTPQERRRIRRRIANRESARRVRAKRQDLLEDMSIKVRELEESNAALMQRAASVEGKHASMLEQVAQISECLRLKAAENEQLMSELEQMRHSLSVTGSSASMDLDMLKEACGNFSFRLTAVEAGPHQQPQPVLPQTISSGFAGSAFGPAAGLPLDPLPANVPRPVVNSGATLPLMGDMPAPGQAPSPHPARMLSKELSLGQVAALSMDRSLSEFLKEVTCF